MLFVLVVARDHFYIFIHAVTIIHSDAVFISRRGLCKFSFYKFDLYLKGEENSETRKPGFLT